MWGDHGSAAHQGIDVAVPELRRVVSGRQHGRGRAPHGGRPAPPTHLKRGMRVLIAAGGTGGHLYPGVALAREFARLEPGSEAIFVGTDRGLETKVVPREGFELITITARGVMGRGMWGAVQGLAAVPVGLLQCLAICRQRRPDLAIGIGGYTSPPLVLAAFLLGIKRAILEPNVHPGVANRVLSPFANLIFVSFAATVPFFAPGKTRIVGTPIRREFLETSPEPPPDRVVGGPTLVVLGGSQGAQSINRAMVAALPRLLAAHPGASRGSDGHPGCRAHGRDARCGDYGLAREPRPAGRDGAL